ncbi:MAG: CPBP family intramembrane glutamic endopeptidase [Acidobacteriota bacterium]
MCKWLGQGDKTTATRSIDQTLDPLAPAVVGVVCVCAIASTAILRSFHRSVPHVPGIPGPLGSVLLWLFAALLLWHWRQRRNGLATLPHRANPTVALAHLAPFVALLIGEKWITGQLLSPILNWIDGDVVAEPFRDSAYRAVSGAALLIAVLVLLPLLRSTARRVRRALTARRARQALLAGLVAAALTAIPVLAVELFTGAAIHAQLAPRFGFAAIGTQVLLGVAEELFFRGTLQISVVGLFLAAGMRRGRGPRLLGIGIVSVGFALEHIDPFQTPSTAAPALLYVFLMSGMLGALLETSRNLYLAMIGHVGLNLCIAELLPLPRDGQGVALLSGSVIGLFFVAALFGTVAVGHAIKARQRLSST